MSRFRRFAKISAFVLVGAIAALLCAYPRQRRVRIVPFMKETITADQALAVVRSFEPAAAHVKFGTDSGLTDVKPGPSHAIDIETQDATFTISRRACLAQWHTFDQVAFYGSDYDRLLKYGKSLPGKMLSDIACRFARKHSPDGKVLRIQYYWSAPGSGAAGQKLRPLLHICWFYRDPGGLAFIPDKCSVMVESLTGRIVLFYSQSIPIVAPTRPSLSSRQAMNRAMMMLVVHGNAGSVLGLGVTDPDVDGKERLVYEVTFSGDGPPDNYGKASMYGPFISPPPWWWWATVRREHHWYTALIDANTGELLCWTAYRYQSAYAPYITTGMGRQLQY